MVKSETSFSNFLLYDVELQTKINLTSSQEILSYVSRDDNSYEEQNKILKAMIISQQRKYRKLEIQLRSLVAYHRQEQQAAQDTKTSLEIWINDLNQQLEAARLRFSSLAFEHKREKDLRDMTQCPKQPAEDGSTLQDEIASILDQNFNARAFPNRGNRRSACYPVRLLGLSGT
eukprot:Phypoly_transcript_11653.p1 GENE.Phypoly_transcript_11653~~Phypoly_transcript_11653.p1  ORF type:complete len:174 (+),score=19.00 Phypoly_transcript_11653:466-987(+)